MVKELLINTLILMVVFIPLERLRPIKSDKKILRSGWQTDAVYLLASGFVVAIGMTVIIGMGVFTIGKLVPSGFKAAIAGQPVIVQLIEILLIADFGFYWIHRGFHAFSVLWRFHSVHHSIEQMDWLAGHRVHPLDQILTRGVSLMPIFVLGFSDLSIVIFAAIYKWQSHLIHSNADIRFGPLKWIAASPEFHHWHHSDDREAFDKNFAGQLPVFDKVFGTMHMPQGKKPSGYGAHDPVPAGFVDQMLYPFKGEEGGAEQSIPSHQETI